MENKSAEELLAAVDDARQLVEIVRSGGRKLMEIMTCLHEIVDTKQTISAMAKETLSSISRLQGLGRELEGAIKDSQAALGTAGDDSDVKIYETINSSQKRCRAAHDSLLKTLEGFGRDDPLLWESMSGTAKRPRVGAGEDGPKLTQAVVQGAQQAVGKSMHFELRNASGKACSPEDAVEILAVCPGVLHAFICLSAQGAPEPLRVVVFSPDELDQHAWSSSSFLVHRRISALATRAMYHFLTRSRTKAASVALAKETQASAEATQQSPDSSFAVLCGQALEDLLLWLSTYSDLFSRPCKITGCLLAADLSTQLMIPPVMRPYKIPRNSLKAMASDPSKREAYHLHITPFNSV